MIQINKSVKGRQARYGRSDFHKSEEFLGLSDNAGCTLASLHLYLPAKTVRQHQRYKKICAVGKHPTPNILRFYYMLLVPAP